MLTTLQHIARADLCKLLEQVLQSHSLHRWFHAHRCGETQMGRRRGWRGNGEQCIVDEFGVMDDVRCSDDAHRAYRSLQLSEIPTDRVAA